MSHHYSSHSNTFVYTMTRYECTMLVGSVWTLITACHQTMKVLNIARRKGHALAKVCADLLPFLAFFPSMVVWFFISPVALTKLPILSTLLVCSIFVEMVTHVMLVHVCGTEIEPWKRGFALLMPLLPLCSYYLSLAGEGTRGSVIEGNLIYILSAYTTYSALSMFFQVYTESAVALNIYIFKLGNRKLQKA